MGLNTVIRLPLHVRTNQVLEVLARVAGEAYRLEAFERAAFDPGEDPGEDNPWHVRFKRRQLQARPSRGCMDFGYLQFQDAAGQNHAWAWHTEDEMEQYKSLRPGAHALAVAAGRRLVRFFGGNMTYSDYNDQIDFAVDPAAARLVPITAQQSSNDRWYQFHKLLHAEGLLTQVEIAQAAEKMGWRKEEKALMAHLPVNESGVLMQKHTPAAGPARPAPRM